MLLQYQTIGIMNLEMLFQTLIADKRNWFLNSRSDNKFSSSEAEFYGDLVYKFRQTVRRAYFSDQFRKWTIR